MNKYGIIKKGIILGLICNLFCSPILVYAADWRYSNGTTGFQQQEKPTWCWVASARNMAVSKYTSVNVTKSQEKVVKEIKGDAYIKENDV